MSIASEITRLQTAKSDLKTSIENKGVTVPSATTLDGYSVLVDQISTGATLQSKSVTPTESAQTVSPDVGYDGLSSVSVGAISSTYIGSDITQRSSSDLTASGATVTAPSGYYAANASKAVASGSASTPATTVTANPSISVNSSGLITASVSATKSVTPTVSAGYVSSGTAGTITVSGSNTQQLTTKAAATYTPTTSTQTIASGQYLTGAQTINPIPSEYIIPSGSISITSNGTVDVTDYASAIVNVSAGPSSFTVGFVSMLPNGTETITYTGTTSGTVNITSGTASVTLDAGTYRFVSSNSDWDSGDIAISGDTTINCYYGTPLFWYGTFNSSLFTNSWTNQNTNHSVGTSISVTGTGSSSLRYCANNSAIDFTPYSALRMYSAGSTSTASYHRVGLTSSNTSPKANVFTYIASQGAKALREIDLSAVNRTGYIAIGVQDGSSRTTSVYALWLV